MQYGAPKGHLARKALITSISRNIWQRAPISEARSGPNRPKMGVRDPFFRYVAALFSRADGTGPQSGAFRKLCPPMGHWRKKTSTEDGTKVLHATMGNQSCRAHREVRNVQSPQRSPNRVLTPVSAIKGLPIYYL